MQKAAMSHQDDGESEALAALGSLAEFAGCVPSSDVFAQAIFA